MTKTWAAVSAAVLALVMTGCSTSTIGQDCVLVSSAGPITEGKIAGQQQKDVISIGSPECDDLVCVRSANSDLWPTGVVDSSDLREAHGECSRPCSPNSEGSCPSDGTSEDAFTCRALVLDSEVLAAYRQSNPTDYQKYFGNTESPFYCARPLGVGGI